MEKVQLSRSYRPDEHLLKSSIFAVTLNPFFLSQDSPTNDGLPSNKVFLRNGSAVQKIKQKQSYFDSMSPRCDHDLEDDNLFRISDGTPARYYMPPFQVCSQKAERFRSYRPDTTRTHLRPRSAFDDSVPQSSQSLQDTSESDQ